MLEYKHTGANGGTHCHSEQNLLNKIADLWINKSLAKSFETNYSNLMNINTVDYIFKHNQTFPT